MVSDRLAVFLCVVAGLGGMGVEWCRAWLWWWMDERKEARRADMRRLWPSDPPEPRPVDTAELAELLDEPDAAALSPLVREADWSVAGGLAEPETVAGEVVEAFDWAPTPQLARWAGLDDGSNAGMTDEVTPPTIVAPEWAVNGGTDVYAELDWLALETRALADRCLDIRCELAEVAAAVRGPWVLDLPAWGRQLEAA